MGAEPAEGSMEGAMAGADPPESWEFLEEKTLEFLGENSFPRFHLGKGSGNSLRKRFWNSWGKDSGKS